MEFQLPHPGKAAVFGKPFDHAVVDAGSGDAGVQAGQHQHDEQVSAHEHHRLLMDGEYCCLE